MALYSRLPGKLNGSASLVKPCQRVVPYGRYDTFDLQACGIDAEMIIFPGTPFLVCEQPLVAGSSLINLADFFLQLPVGQMLAGIRPAAAPVQFGCQIRVNKNFKGIRYKSPAVINCPFPLNPAYSTKLLEMTKRRTLHKKSTRIVLAAEYFLWQHLFIANRLKNKTSSIGIYCIRNIKR